MNRLVLSSSIEQTLISDSRFYCKHNTNDTEHDITNIEEKRSEYNLEEYQGVTGNNVGIL